MFVGEAESVPVCMASTQKTGHGGKCFNPYYFEICGRKSLKWRNDICSNIGHNDIKLVLLTNLLFRYKKLVCLAVVNNFNLA
jgi:hypothetical protein